MLFKSWAIILLTACSLGEVAHAQQLDPRQLFEKVAPSIVTIFPTLSEGQERKANGSGVVIAKDTVVTNCHVLRRAKFIFVKHETTEYRASLEFPDTARD